MQRIEAALFLGQLRQRV
jgi:hypothetical protein